VARIAVGLGTLDQKEAILVEDGCGDGYMSETLRLASDEVGEAAVDERHAWHGAWLGWRIDDS